MPAGTVELTLGAAEHREARVRVEVPKDGVAVVDHVLERIAYGTLTLELELTPPDAAVTVGATGLAYRPGMRVPEGRHQLTVSRDGYAEATTTVEVSGATRERIELDLLVVPAGPAGMEFVWVPAGEFRMGSTSSEARL